MAPVPRRPPPASLIQQQPLLAPSFPSAQPASLIPRKLFFQLLVGTVCIFIFAVVIWKFPRFLRFFTRARVLSGGKKTTSRYSKTWYGWVTPQKHVARKRAVKSCMAKLRSWLSWSSSTSEFEWVWSDPGQKELGSYHRRRSQGKAGKRRRHGLATSDGMWDFMSPSDPSPMTMSSLGAPSIPFAAGALPPPNTFQPRSNPLGGSMCSNPSGDEGSGCTSELSTRPRLPNARISQSFGSESISNTDPYIRNNLTSSLHLPFPRTTNGNRPMFSNGPQTIQHSFSMPCLLQSERFLNHPEFSSSFTASSKNAGSQDFMPNVMSTFQRSRKYQAWSARLGLQTLRCLGYSTHSLPQVPPGSPRTTMLGSLSLESTALVRTHSLARGISSSGASDLSLRGNEQQRIPGRLATFSEFQPQYNAPTSWNSMPPSREHFAAFRRPRLVKWHVDASTPEPNSPKKTENQDNEEKKVEPARSDEGGAALSAMQTKDWSDWEVRMIDNLHRRLEWLSNQFTPGIRPFHFALLANHWLNRGTWIVYDPISRVNLDNRRLWGDPRFNVPYPQPPPKSYTPKYPRVDHRPAKTPHINSWRLAVNRNRRASGLKTFLRRIELYDSSAEDPPDGKIDPASWMLRRPPQGFNPSARQGERYYEGGTGWQEKYSDWQRIRRGYRIRKAIYEGRVNRTRVKEIAYAISRSYRQATSRFGHTGAGRGGHCLELSVGEAA